MLKKEKADDSERSVAVSGGIIHQQRKESSHSDTITGQKRVEEGGQETLPFPNQNSLFKLHLQNIYIYIEGVDIYYIYILKTDIPQRNKITCTVDT